MGDIVRTVRFAAPSPEPMVLEAVIVHRAPGRLRRLLGRWCLRLAGRLLRMRVRVIE